MVNGAQVMTLVENLASLVAMMDQESLVKENHIGMEAGVSLDGGALVLAHHQAPSLAREARARVPRVLAAAVMIGMVAGQVVIGAMIIIMATVESLARVVEAVLESLARVHTVTDIGTMLQNHGAHLQAVVASLARVPRDHLNQARDPKVHLPMNIGSTILILTHILVLAKVP